MGLDSTACMHLSTEIWFAVCHLFHHDPLLRTPEYIVKVHGFGRHLLPVQAHGVWHALQMFHSPVKSVFLCHMMGISKTTMAFAIHYVRHTINRMWTHIQKNPSKHKVDTDLTSDSCPSNNEMFQRYGFHCPCTPQSPTQFIKLKLGVSGAIVPLVY